MHLEERLSPSNWKELHTGHQKGSPHTRKSPVYLTVRTPSIVSFLQSQLLESHRHIKSPFLLKQSLQSQVSFRSSSCFARQSSFTDESFVGLQVGDLSKSVRYGMEGLGGEPH